MNNSRAKEYSLQRRLRDFSIENTDQSNLPTSLDVKEGTADRLRSTPSYENEEKKITLPLNSLTFLLLYSAAVCWGYGFEGCTQKYYDKDKFWCSRRDIKNLSPVVKRIPQNASEINLSRNHISTIPADVFRKFWRLKELSLQRNRITSLGRGQFNGLGELNYLNISSNILSDINSEAFQGLTKLQKLHLYDNHLAEIPVEFFKFLPQIRTVVLSQNKLKALNGSLYSSKTLCQLDVASNRISYLNLHGFPALVSLDLSHNPLLHISTKGPTFIPSLTELLVSGIGPEFLAGLPEVTLRTLRTVSFSVSVQTSPNITVCSLLAGMPNVQDVTIDLGGSGFQGNASVLIGCHAPKFLYLRNASLGDMSGLRLVQELSQTTRLTLDRCRLRTISETMFQGLQNLVYLSIQDTGDLDIHADAFFTLKKLKKLRLNSVGVRKPNPDWFRSQQNLRVLLMLKNQMTELTTNAFAALRKLTTLSLRYNFIQVIANKPFCNLTLLKILDLSMNIISHIEKGSFECLINLRELNLGGNCISKVNPDTFLGLGHLSTLTLYNNHLHFQKGDSPFTGLRSLKNLNLFYQGPESVGMGYLGPTLFNGLTNLVSLNLGFVSLTTFDPEVFAPVARLKMLFIANIEMTNTNLTALFRHLTSLEDLFLMQSDLDFLPDILFPPQNSLKYLKIQSNHFHILETSLRDNLPMLEYLDVTGNPLSCSCENAWFKNWSVNSVRVQVAYLYDLHCNNDPKAPYLWQFDDRACGYDLVCFNYFVSTAVLDILFLLLGLTWHKYRSSIRYLILLLRSRVGGRKKGRKEDFTYDAFISYSSRDDPWVMGELVPRMEGPNGKGFRLCLHHRDFRLGAAILENIEAAIYSSRRTLCVVSRDFLRSEWCSLEFQLASLRLLCDHSDVLLLVFLEKIPDHSLSPYTRLRRMVRKNTYLLWPENASDQEAFWVRLQDALGEGMVEEEENDEFARLLG